MAFSEEAREWLPKPLLQLTSLWASVSCYLDPKIKGSGTQCWVWGF